MLLFGIPYWRRPQGSVDTGTFWRNFIAGALNLAGSMRLSVKPHAGDSVICLPLQDGAVMAVKSPLSIACVGTKLTDVGGLLFSVRP